jgi:NADPH:quinone reductase-like Zn-dependent oxidoreductase
MAPGVKSVSVLSLEQLGQVELHDATICISLLELESEFLASMVQEDMDLLRKVTNTVIDLVWMTGANSLGSLNPDLTLAHGLARAVMLEQPALRFSILDVGSIGTDTDLQPICESIVSTMTPLGDKDDKEFVLYEGLLHVNRFGPDNSSNAMFQRRMQRESNPVQTQLADASPARLSIGKVGVTDTIHFQQLVEPQQPLPEGFVEIDVKAVSLNAKDVYAINGRVETRCNTTSCEFSGVVMHVGTGVDHVKEGDRIVALAPNRFETVTRVPAWAVHKILPSEDFATVSSLPIVYSTAIYALEDKAQLRTGETVLIHSGAGALGLAAITIARRLGAIVYTTVGSQAKKEYLINHMGIQNTHIFSSRDVSFAQGVREMTNGKGVDVVLNSLVGDLMHASWDCVADFGRFVEVGKRELVDAGKLAMRVFLRNVSFIAFDFSDLFHHKDRYYNNITTRYVSAPPARESSLSRLLNRCRTAKRGRHWSFTALAKSNLHLSKYLTSLKSCKGTGTSRPQTVLERLSCLSRVKIALYL